MMNDYPPSNDPLITVIQRQRIELDRLTVALADANAELLKSTQAECSEVRRLRDAIVSARWQLAKGRAIWNGPCHQCDYVLNEALSVNKIYIPKVLVDAASKDLADAERRGYEAARMQAAEIAHRLSDNGEVAAAILAMEMNDG